MKYQLKYHKAADKELSKLEPSLQIEIVKLILQLKLNPKPFGSKKLVKYTSERTKNKACYRIRYKNFIIIYTIENEIVTITVVKIAHRKEVYS
jgi:mRNA interferase RelE/StbE